MTINELKLKPHCSFNRVFVVLFYKARHSTQIGLKFLIKLLLQENDKNLQAGSFAAKHLYIQRPKAPLTNPKNSSIVIFWFSTSRTQNTLEEQPSKFHRNYHITINLFLYPRYCRGPTDDLLPHHPYLFYLSFPAWCGAWSGTSWVAV